MAELRVRRRVTGYGRSPEAALRIVNEEPGARGSRFRLEGVGELELNVPGAHNVLNATAVTAVMLELGVSAEKIREGLASYRGTGRRMERGLLVVFFAGYINISGQTDITRPRCGRRSGRCAQWRPSAWWCYSSRTVLRGRNC